MIKKNILLISCTIALFGLFSFRISEKLNKEIIGTWQSEEDASIKWVFNDSGKTCVWYIDNQSSDSFTYSISNSSPQCGFPVDVDNETMYLKLTDINTNDEYCYEINGVNYDNSGILSIRHLGTNKIYIFKKKVESGLD